MRMRHLHQNDGGSSEGNDLNSLTGVSHGTKYSIIIGKKKRRFRTRKKQQQDSMPQAHPVENTVQLQRQTRGS